MGDVSATRPTSIDELWTSLQDWLKKTPYAVSYPAESEFEQDVWLRVVAFATELELDVDKACLTSHADRTDRSPAAWTEFCQEAQGPDVNVLGSNNRLDIVLRHPRYGSIGIEVKCLGGSGHAGKLTQGLGQAMLGLAHRHRTVLVIHCGSVDANERKRLQEIGNKVCEGTRTAVVAVSWAGREMPEETRDEVDIREASRHRHLLHGDRPCRP